LYYKIIYSKLVLGLDRFRDRC